ncbi:MAG: TIGR00725 family protein [Burkholderiales bacterium]
MQQRQLGLLQNTRPLRQPVSIVGPRDATETQLACARRLGTLLAEAKVPVLCGGKGGVMEAASCGVQQSGGIVIGLLPEDDDQEANHHLTVALPTGMGISRNALIARACTLMVAIGGGLGTMSEMALALQWTKPVFSIHHAPEVPGHRAFETEEAMHLALFIALLEI